MSNADNWNLGDRKALERYSAQVAAGKLDVKMLKSFLFYCAIFSSHCEIHFLFFTFSFH